MKRRRNSQRQSPLGAARLQDFAGLFHRRLAASNHGLRTVVEIGGLNHFGTAGAKTGLRLGATRDHASRIQAQDGRHRAGTDRNGFLHRRSPKADQGRRLCQRQHA